MTVLQNPARGAATKSARYRKTGPRRGGDQLRFGGGVEKLCGLAAHHLSAALRCRVTDHRNFGILNETVKPGTAFYGIPYPGTFIVNVQGKVKSKYFEDDFRERVSASDILIHESGKQADGGRRVAETKLVASPALPARGWRGPGTGLCSAWTLP